MRNVTRRGLQRKVIAPITLAQAEFKISSPCHRGVTFSVGTRLCLVPSMLFDFVKLHMFN
jgi:hypothetical protein